MQNEETCTNRNITEKINQLKCLILRQDLIKGKLGIAENIVTEQAHQRDKKGNSESPRKPRTIVC